MKYDILNRWSGEVIFTAEIECGDDTHSYIKLGLAIKSAIRVGANLEDANLENANLRSANLIGANLEDANLENANLENANLIGANLRSANLIGANLRSANLRSANLEDANLIGANLEDANLRSANLIGANLRSANLRSANLRSANLIGANLENANLRSANLEDANLESVKSLKTQPTQTIILPEGDLIVYKKLVEGVAKLKIPSSAKRYNATGRKCRAEYAEVIELPDGVKVGHSKYCNDFEYEVGKIVRPDKWDDNWVNECSNGIHFFITKEEAENY